VLHAVALDQHRWNALAAFNVGLAALILLQASPERRRRDDREGLPSRSSSPCGASRRTGCSSTTTSRPTRRFHRRSIFLVRAIRTPDSRDVDPPD
jgi:hypothetical protein